jgi:adenylate cyclase
MARLILATAEGQQAIDLRPSNSLGRHPNNTIQLLDKIVSKEHCILEQREGHFVLRDLGSLNGTYVNGERVRGELLLKHGDDIALGSTRARYDDGSGAALPLPPVGPGAVQHSMSAPPWSGGPAPRSTAGTPSAIPAVSQVVAPRGSYPSFTGPTAPAVSQAPVPPPVLARPPSVAGTRVDVLDAARAIGTQIAAQAKGFMSFDGVSHDVQQLRLDYERLRISWELTRDIGLERDLDRLLDKVLLALFKFTKADRGVILLRDEQGNLHPRAARRRDGTDTPIQVSSTILNHVITERASVLTHDASTDFAASKGKSMILNRISSAMVVPLLHQNEKEVLGVLWVDSEALAQFQPKDLEVLTSVAGQAAMFIENTILAKRRTSPSR